MHYEISLTHTAALSSPICSLALSISSATQARDRPADHNLGGFPPMQDLPFTSFSQHCWS